MARVTIVGPNLPRPACDLGTMHVHAAGCADLVRNRSYRRANAWTVEAASVLDVVADIYPPSDFDYDINDESERMQYEYDIHFAPCVKFAGEK